MILSHPTLDNSISFDEGKVNVLVVENQIQLRKYVQELNNQANGLDGLFSLYDRTECINLCGRIKVLLDPFNLDFNAKEIMTPLLSKLSALALDSSHYQSTNDLLSSIMAYFSNLTFDFDVDLDYRDISIQDLIKSIGIKIDRTDSDILLNICDYFDTVSRYTKIKLFVVINIRDFLSGDEIVLLNQYLLYNKIHVLFIESKEHVKHENESIIVIDSDLCEISDDIS